MSVEILNPIILFLLGIGCILEVLLLDLVEKGSWYACREGFRFDFIS